MSKPKRKQRPRHQPPAKPRARRKLIIALTAVLLRRSRGSRINSIEGCAEERSKTVESIDSDTRLPEGINQGQKEARELLSTLASGLRNFKLFTNCANCPLFDFPMAGEAGDLALRRVQPYGVFATLAKKETTLFAQVPLQVDPFHTSGSSMISRTASDGRFFAIKSRWHSKTSFSASKRFTLASASVSPCEIAAGISSTKQVYPPSLAGAKTAVSFINTDYHTPVSLQIPLAACLPGAGRQTNGVQFSGFRRAGAENAERKMLDPSVSAASPR